MSKSQQQAEGQFEQPEAKTEFKSSFKSWIRVVAFIVIVVFLPGQVAQARPVGRYSSAVNWSKWSNNLLLNIAMNIGMNMAASSFKGGIKQFPSNFMHNFGSNFVSGFKAMAISYGVQSFVAGQAATHGWSPKETAMMGALLGGFASGLSSSLSSMRSGGINLGSASVGRVLSNAMFTGAITGVSQATATRVYLSIYKETNPRSNATALIASLAAGLLTMQLGKSIFPSAFGIKPSTPSTFNFNLGDFWRNNRTIILASAGGAAQNQPASLLEELFII